MRTKEWLIECKNTAPHTARGEKTFSVDLKWLEQIVKEAQQERRLPALIWQYTNHKTLWVTLPLTVFEQVLEELARLRDLTRPSSS